MECACSCRCRVDWLLCMRNRRHHRIGIFTASLLLLIVTLLHLREQSGKTLSSFRRRGDGENTKIQLKQNKSHRYVDTLETISDGEFINSESVTAPSHEFTNLGMIVINLRKIIHNIISHFQTVCWEARRNSSILG